MYLARLKNRTSRNHITFSLPHALPCLNWIKKLHFTFILHYCSFVPFQVTYVRVPFKSQLNFLLYYYLHVFQLVNHHIINVRSELVAERGLRTLHISEKRSNETITCDKTPPYFQLLLLYLVQVYQSSSPL